MQDVEVIKSRGTFIIEINETYIIVLSGVKGNSIDRVFICQCSDIKENEAIFIELLFKGILKGVDIVADWTQVHKLTLLNVDIVNGELSDTMSQNPNFTVSVYGEKKVYNRTSNNNKTHNDNTKADRGGKRKKSKKSKKKKPLKKRKTMKNNK